MYLKKKIFAVSSLLTALPFEKEPFGTIRVRRGKEEQQVQKPIEKPVELIGSKPATFTDKLRDLTQKAVESKILSDYQYMENEVQKVVNTFTDVAIIAAKKGDSFESFWLGTTRSELYSNAADLLKNKLNEKYPGSDFDVYARDLRIVVRW